MQVAASFIVFLSPRPMQTNESYAQQPNPPLNSDPARTIFRSLSASGFLGFVQRLGAGGAG
jgi:hypothetical protein